jgi:hypothetical protein
VPCGCVMGRRFQAQRLAAQIPSKRILIKCPLQDCTWTSRVEIPRSGAAPDATSGHIIAVASSPTHLHLLHPGLSASFATYITTPTETADRRKRTEVQASVLCVSAESKLICHGSCFQTEGLGTISWEPADPLGITQYHRLTWGYGCHLSIMARLQWACRVFDSAKPTELEAMSRPVTRT